GLVGALAAGNSQETIAGERFARIGETRRKRDQIHVDAADDDDSRHAGSLRNARYDAPIYVVEASAAFIGLSFPSGKALSPRVRRGRRATPYRRPGRVRTRC